MTRGPKAKYWCFTLNNPPETKACTENVYCCGYNPDTHEYMVQGIERGKNGTLHIQGYVAFHKRHRLSQLKKWLPSAHWEPAKGSPGQNLEYCTKDHSYCQHGDLPEKTQGKRNDLELLHDTLKTGAGLRTVLDDHFASFIRYERSIRSAIALYAPKRSWEMEIIILWGASGTGKTRKAYADYPESYWKDNSPWWDHYEGQETVIWDEFSGSSAPLNLFLRLTDRYPMSVPYKGGYANFTSKRIIFTSNIDPDDWYQFRNNELKIAFQRRITERIEYKRLVNSSP